MMWLGVGTELSICLCSLWDVSWSIVEVVWYILKVTRIGHWLSKFGHKYKKCLRSSSVTNVVDSIARDCNQFLVNTENTEL